MKRIAAIFILFFSFLIKAQPPTAFYTKFGGAGIDIGYGVKQTLDRQYIVVGSTSSYGAGNTDVYLVKVDSMGLPLWGKTFGGFGNDVGRSVIQLPDSSYVLAGYTNSFGSGGYDAYVVRTDKAGNLTWQKTFGGLDWDFAYDLVYSADGNIVICGTTSSFGHGNMDGFVIKFDLSGTLIWQKFYGGVEDDELKCIFTKNGSEYFLGGSTKSFGEINGDLLCYKVDNNGDSLMRIVYGGSLWDGANSLVVTSGNEIILAGGTLNSTGGGKDAIFARFDSNGNFIIRKTYGYADDEEVFKIVLSPVPSLAETVSIYTTHELAGYKGDTKTIYLNAALDWFGGQNSGKFGFTGDDEVFDVVAKDKGCVEIGYTTSLGAMDKDVFLVKADSTLWEDFSIVGLEKIVSKNEGITIYPNPIQGDEDLHVTLFSPDDFLEIEIVSSAGVVLFNESYSSVSINIPFKNYSAGLYFVRAKTKKQIGFFKIVKE